MPAHRRSFSPDSVIDLPPIAHNGFRIDYVHFPYLGRMRCYDLRETIARLEWMSTNGFYDPHVAIVNIGELRHIQAGNLLHTAVLASMAGDIDVLDTEAWFHRYGVERTRDIDRRLNHYERLLINALSPSLIDDASDSDDDDESDIATTYYDTQEE